MSAPTARAFAIAAATILLAACGGTPAVSLSPAAEETPPAVTPSPQPTVQPTETPLALVRDDVTALRTNSVTFKGIDYTVLEGVITNQDPREYAEGAEPEPSDTFHLILSMRGQNDSPRRPSVEVSDFGLVLDDAQEVPPTRLFGTTEAFLAPGRGTAADGFLAFEVERDVDLSDAVLQIGRAPDRQALLMLTDEQPAPEFPMVLDVSGEARGVGVTNSGQMRYTLLGGAFHIDNPLESANNETGERANQDELFLVLDIRLLLESGRVEGAFREQFRLIVDGALRQPWNFPAGGSIGPGASLDTQVGWLIPTGLSEVVLEVGQFDANPGRIPISLPPTD